MYEFTAGVIAGAVSGEILQGDPGIVFKQVSTDTRQINEGDLFIALVGERFDAHNFIDSAISQKAAGVIVSREVDTGAWHGPVILVRDTLKALQDLAAHNRSQFRGLVIGVTGSNGKTTTKDLIAAVLEQRYAVLKTEGNLNNHIGLPLTLLKMDDNYGAAVLEMGMRGLGEIDLLAGIVKPDGAVITNIGETHLERLGSVANIARAKGEILDHIEIEGFAVLNGDDPLVRDQAGRCKGRVVFYGTNGDMPFTAQDIRSPEGRSISFTALTPEGEIDLDLHVPGRHNVLNALAAVCVGFEAGVSLSEIKNGLMNARLTSMRLSIIEGARATVIDDSYNANPVSVKAALEILAEMGRDKRKIAILGDMYELGTRVYEGHREVGETAADRQVEVLVTVGELAREIALGAALTENPPAEIISFNTAGETREILAKVVRKGDVVLVKGSRGVKMESIVEYLLKMT
ncbi:UDP-N-acetylmuramoyl-tripeptide--D-alanyl-D-alanine ligase [Phosphitispora sp. TUW77]|uniref:UDP-N-acetylmuramoyl-tripeptide--D-alanyl-D- alanine ligase n=1 Tax=Phosphitispora sp. TUW77 TaxID=3152361 RepID=UPI003AB2BA00